MHLPARLNDLLAAGVWPRDVAQAHALSGRFTPEQVRRVAPEESELCLLPPPFHTVGEHARRDTAGHFWSRFGALDQIDPDQALIIADFGLGSDAPIVLDLAHRPEDPPVLRLRWGADGTAWVTCAESFAAFAELLGW